jgi:hypothetical protein
MRPKARLMPGFFLLGAIWQKRGHRKNGGSLFVQGRRYFERPGEDAWNGGLADLQPGHDEP